MGAQHSNIRNKMCTPASELEAKYLNAPGYRADRRIAKVLEALETTFDLELEREVHIKDTYFDTSEMSLNACGWSYRVREGESCAGTRLQQLKSLDAMWDANTVRRLEVSESVSMAQHQPAGEIATRLAEMLGEPSTLCELFEQTNVRTMYRLCDPTQPAAHATLCIDQVTLGGKTPMRYLEFEIETPHRDLLRQTQRVIEPIPGVIPSRMSKYARGTMDHDTVNRSETPLPGTMGVLGAAHLNNLLTDLHRFEPFAYESTHPEGIHAMRVTARRLSAAIALYRPYLSRELARDTSRKLDRLIRVLGRSRDWDVLAEQSVKKSNRASHEYREEVRLARRRAHEKMRKRLSGLARGELEGAIAEQAVELRAGPLNDTEIDSVLIKSLLERPLKSIAKQSARINALPDLRLHNLRINIKRTKYQLGLFLGHEVPGLKHIHRRLSQLQERIGDYHDLQIAETKLGTALPKKLARSNARKAIQLRNQLPRSGQKLIKALQRYDWI